MGGMPKTWDHEQEIDARNMAERSLRCRENQVDLLRVTMTDIVESFSKNPDIQNHIIDIVTENGHDKHLINRLRRKVNDETS